jgi:hypothetical protein
MLDRVRGKTESLVREAADSDDPTLIESPPASGKTWNAVQLAANTEHKVTYLAGRVDLYEQAKTIAREDAGLTVETIPSPHRDCPTFQGENDGDTDRVHQLYQKGIRARDIHFEGWDTPFDEQKFHARPTDAQCKPRFSTPNFPPGSESPERILSCESLLPPRSTRKPEDASVANEPSNLKSRCGPLIGSTVPAK